MTNSPVGEAPGGPSIDDVVNGVSSGLSSVQDFLKQLSDQINAAGVGGSSAGGVGGAVQSVVSNVGSASSNLSAAANLARALPLIILILGVLVGKPFYGVAGAALLYLYLNSSSTPVKGTP